MNEVSLDLVYDTVYGGNAKLRYVFPPTSFLRLFHHVLHSFATRMSGRAVTFGADFPEIFEPDGSDDLELLTAANHRSVAVRLNALRFRFPRPSWDSRAPEITGFHTRRIPAGRHQQSPAAGASGITNGRSGNEST